MVAFLLPRKELIVKYYQDLISNSNLLTTLFPIVRALCKRVQNVTKFLLILKQTAQTAESI
ncbi:MAG: hypothetical protein CVU39_18215 [Chloroflexi bacterium HGW-Chloroflexi-10]|nr:MAG: hypothetical protein CVU39_18215 [Chloroflexi bacterium HGW-Chloroflexi-10]